MANILSYYTTNELKYNSSFLQKKIILELHEEKFTGLEANLQTKSIKRLNYTLFLGKLEILDISNNILENLYNLEYAKNIKELDISNNLIKDISLKKKCKI